MFLFIRAARLLINRLHRRQLDVTEIWTRSSHVELGYSLFADWRPCPLTPIQCSIARERTS